MVCVNYGIKFIQEVHDLDYGSAIAFGIGSYVLGVVLVTQKKKKRNMYPNCPNNCPPPLAKTGEKNKFKNPKNPKKIFFAFLGDQINSWKTEKYIEKTSKYTRGR